MVAYNFKKHGGIAPKTRDALNWVYENGGLPTISGQWYFVDPDNGTSTAGGSADSPVSNIREAYNLCTTEAGDGIVLLSPGDTSSEVSSYLTYPLDWAKDCITVVGICAPTKMAQRARIASKSLTTGTIATLAFPTATTITDSAEGFLTAGFEVGDLITIATTDGTNDGNAIITAVTAGTITCGASTFTVQTAATAGNSSVVNYIPYLIDVQGTNNSFINCHLGNFDSSALSVGALKVTGNRNFFGNVHAYGAGHATPAATTGAYDVLLDSAQECTFMGCTLGSDTIIRAAANGNLLLDGGVWRARFIECDFVSYSATAGKVAVKSADATSCSGIQMFDSCNFLNWNPNGITAVDDVFGGTAPTSGAYAVTPDSMSVGFTGWGSTVYVAGAAAAASAGGQLATIE